ncbi:MAG TPA: hypothetical protein VKR43_21315 [Bryobacteraceae bacterium]|nr:hypothetical protein [Bryobacteraceae bacterium]
MRIPSLALLLSLSLTGAALPPNLLDHLEWRLLGPFRGGRVIAVSGVARDPATAYFGSVGGGVWKTEDAGATWNPIFDSQHVGSIGAIAVAPSNPNVVYVGSGEADMRSQIGFGDGMYKSTDAGKTWRNVGLRDSRQIAKILVDPHDANLVYVAVLGHAYGPNAERGVFRSKNGGESWEKVLDRGAEVGAVDLVFEPEDTRIIYATVWNGHRPPWSQYGPIEGPGSGLWKSTDGGDHWTNIAGHGLPPAAGWRRSGIATGAGHRVYLLLDAQDAGGLYRSDDAGANWSRVNANQGVVSRGWYFSGISVSPKNPDDVWIPNVALYHSLDGGKTFLINRGAPGGDDYHILWIDPVDPRHLILGSDQGTNVSLNGGKSWTSWYNQPTAQFYHVITDNQFPYWVYGSQQDSGTAAVPIRTNHGEIDARDWITFGGEESGYVAIDPKDPNIIYVGNTNGALNRYDKRTAESQNITPWPMRGAREDISQQKHRYPWTAPLIFSPIEPNTLYFAAQFLFKTVDGGLNWQTISPDLTGAGNKGALDERIAKGYGVIYAVGPSPLRAGMIWAGSDTGLLHLTRDGGKTWSKVKELPAWSRVTQIEASHFDPAVAYASVDRHRMEDYKPYIYRTRDSGKTWDLINSGLEEPAYVNSIKEDPQHKGLLFAATELGVAVSFDDGDHWQSLQRNLPTVSVRDLVIHGDDLVVATHGRAFWVLDNISALRQLDGKVATSDAFLFKPATAIRLNPESFSGSPFPVEEPKAKNPPEGACIDYFLKTSSGPVSLEFVDAKNQVIRRVSSEDPEAPGLGGAVADAWKIPAPRVTTKEGTNRYVWDLRYPSPAVEGAGRGGASGPQVLPGTYNVRLTANGRTTTQPLKVVLDPRSKATPADLSKQLEFSLSVSKALGQVADAMREARDLRRQTAGKNDSLNADLAKLIGAGGRGGGSGEPSLSSVAAELNTALSVAESADRTPPAQAVQLFERANRELAAQLARWKSLRDSAR